MTGYWVCPDKRCEGFSVTSDDVVRVTCTRRVPHLAERKFPDMVYANPRHLRDGIEDVVRRLDAGAPRWEAASRLRDLLRLKENQR